MSSRFTSNTSAQRSYFRLSSNHLKSSFEESFWEKVNTPVEGCWEWQGATTSGGYGVIRSREGKKPMLLAHRVMLSWVLGRRPKMVRHLCDNPRCVRPSHLKEGTQQENIRDAIEAGRHVSVLIQKVPCPHCQKPVSPRSILSLARKQVGGQQVDRTSNSFQRE